MYFIWLVTHDQWDRQTFNYVPADTEFELEKQMGHFFMLR